VRGLRELSVSPEHFHEHGWMRLPGAIDPAATAAMREVVWRGLAAAGIRREDPSSWTVERPARLQRLRGDRAFAAAGSPTVLAAIDRIMGGRPWDVPTNWGSLFLAFPTGGEWAIPAGGWHIDAKYTSPLDPPRGVKTLALIDDVAPASGGTLIVGGSHRLVHRWFAGNPPPAGTRSADMRKLLLAHPYLRDLQTGGDRAGRMARFMDRAETDAGIGLQVVEMTGSAGDVYLLHPLTMHAAAPNAGTAPRLMLSGGVTTDQWGWASA
jgi:hypothetical protein